MNFEKGFDKQYDIVVSLLEKHGTVYKKKHGDHIVLQGKNSFIALDTWNGYINIIDGIFDGEYYSSTFNKGEQMARRISGRGVETTKIDIARAYQFILSII